MLAILILSMPVGARAASIGPEDESLMAMDEAAVMSTALLVERIGVAPAAITYTGTAGAVGWNLSLLGRYDQLPLALSFASSFDATLSVGDFTVNGSYGNAPWLGLGSFGFTTLNPDAVTMTWSYHAQFGSIVEPDDTEILPAIPKSEECDDFEDDELLCADHGFYLDTINDLPSSEPKEEISLRIKQKHPEPEPPDPDTFVTITLPDDQIRLVGSGFFVRGEETGEISVPEPSFLGSVSIGLLLFGAPMLSRLKRSEERRGSGGRAHRMM